MRDEQVRRYARHILLPDVGGLGQTALLTSAVRLELRESEPDAELLAAMYLAAGGVGGLMIRGATEAQLAEIAVHGPDTRLADSCHGRDLVLQPKPAWWPATDGDATALAFWRGGIAATRWMAEVANR
ncbi:MAG: hypothetical protein H0T89_36400 [Deltaproteobacteria bacterium]|nr:hypothetical protein [Deltaproteobacteria bacterium]